MGHKLRWRKWYLKQLWNLLVDFCLRSSQGPSRILVLIHKNLRSEKYERPCPSFTKWSSFELDHLLVALGTLHRFERPNHYHLKPLFIPIWGTLIHQYSLWKGWEQPTIGWYAWNWRGRLAYRRWMVVDMCSSWSRYRFRWLATLGESQWIRWDKGSLPWLLFQLCQRWNQWGLRHRKIWSLRYMGWRSCLKRPI